MFKEDIKEFKSSKIYKYLYTCEVYIEGFTRKTQILLRPSRPLHSEGGKRTSQTPDMLSVGTQRAPPASPLLTAAFRQERTPSMWTLREGFSKQAQIETVVNDLKFMELKATQ